MRACASSTADDLEIICVDNASGDGSVEALGSLAGVTLVKSARNLGFAGGCNLGVRHATGEIVAFINNDAKPEPGWLSEAVAVLAHDTTIGCVASKVLDWDGTHIDYVDAALTWFGMGYKPGAGQPFTGEGAEPADVLFATGAAMIMRTRLFEEVGGFDERFFMFYEDVDLGWRLNLLGHRVRYVPTSVVRHRHHASVAAYGEHSEWFLLERNALLAMYKNLSDEALARILAPAMALSIRRSLAVGGADSSMLDIEQGATAGDDTATVSKRSLTASYAIDAFVDMLPSLAKSRAEVQSRRVRSDRELRPLFREVIEPAIPEARYLEGHRTLVDAFGIEELFTSGQRVLVVTGDPLTAKLAGPAIRALHIADALKVEHDVRLVSTSGADLQRDGLTIKVSTLRELRADVAWADVVVFQGFLLAQAPWIAKTDKVLVVDLYDPMHLEQLEQTRGRAQGGRDRDLTSTVGVLNDQLLRGDFFLCANEPQRHFWLGQLAALGRINARTYDPDPSLRELMAVVPFGLPSTPPVRSSSPIRDSSRHRHRQPGDPLGGRHLRLARPAHAGARCCRAVGAARRRTAVLPRHDAPQSRTFPRCVPTVRSQDLAAELGLTGKFVFFNDGWVEFDQRQDYLLDADVGVSTHFDHIETTFSFRTRILDYLWAGLPVVVTEGDSFATVVRDRGIGVVVPAGDPAALADALEKCLYDEELAASCRAAAREVAVEYTWDEVLAPLVEFVRSPRRASDASAPDTSRPPRTPVRERVRHRARVARMAAGRIRRRVTRRP